MLEAIQPKHIIPEREGLKFDLNMLVDYMKKGSVTARRMLEATKYFVEAIRMYLEMDEQFVFKLSKAYEIESLVCIYPEPGLNERVLETVKKILKLQGKEISEFNERTRMCLAFLLFASPTAVDIISDLLRHYPLNARM